MLNWLADGVTGFAYMLDWHFKCSINNFLKPNNLFITCLVMQ